MSNVKCGPESNLVEKSCYKCPKCKNKPVGELGRLDPVPPNKGKFISGCRSSQKSGSVVNAICPLSAAAAESKHAEISVSVPRL